MDSSPVIVENPPLVCSPGQTNGMFDDLNSAGGSRLETRLGDLASRHPELADHFYDFPVTKKFGSIPREWGKSEEHKNTSQSDPRTEDIFDDVNTAGGSRLTAHLGDIAARHPELADHLYDLIPKTKKKFSTGLREHGKAAEPKISTKSKPRCEVGKQHPETTTIGTQTGGLESDVKLRSTVPDMQASAGESVTDGDRGQRSQSAPPQAPVNNKQKEEGVRIIPIRTDSPSCGLPHQGPQVPRPGQSFDQQPHFHSPHQQHFQQGPQPQQQHFSDHGRHEESRGPTVRHIPIFVEGRDEPLLPKDAGHTNTTKRGGCQGKTDSAPPKRGPPPEEKKEHQQPQNHEQNQQPQQTQQQTQTPPPPPPPPQRPDPLALVAEVAKDVEALTARVNEWKGSSRSEKEYIYLDEMLTRNLLKLDNIETEGREEVRTARKDAIRRIQAAISILESKAVADDAVVPVWQGNNGASNTGGEGSEGTEEKKDESMETESSSTAEASQEAGTTSQTTQT